MLFAILLYPSLPEVEHVFNEWYCVGSCCLHVMCPASALTKALQSAITPLPTFKYPSSHYQINYSVVNREDSTRIVFENLSLQ